MAFLQRRGEDATGDQPLLAPGPVLQLDGNDSGDRFVAVADQHLFAFFDGLDVGAEAGF